MHATAQRTLTTPREPTWWIVAASLLTILVAPTAHAQQPAAQQARAQTIQRLCGSATELTQGPEIDEARRIWQRFTPHLNQDKGHRIHVAIVPSNEINAHTNWLNMQELLLCIPSVMTRFMGADGAFVFVLAHEVWHAIDDSCKHAEGREA